MTDENGRSSVHSRQELHEVRTPPKARETRPLPPPARRHSVAGGRIAAAGIGIAAMLGLVANMEVADGSAKAASPAKSPALSAQRTAKGVREGTPAAPGKVAAAKVKRPIVLTPHAVVNTVSAPSSPAAPAEATRTRLRAAAAPVASSGGS